MRKPGGYFCVSEPGERVKENDTFTCKHCQRIVDVKPRCDPTDVGGMCFVCMGLICPRCVNLNVCDPVEKKIQRLIDRHEALRSYGLV